MIDFIVTAVMIFTAYRMGSLRSINVDVSKRTEHIQNLINKAYQKRDIMKNQVVEANLRAETWERRYWALANSSKEQEVGS